MTAAVPALLSCVMLIALTYFKAAQTTNHHREAPMTSL
jgi:hypothetical protein